MSSDSVILREINFLKKIFITPLFYLLHKNFIFGYIFKNYIKVFHYFYKKKFTFLVPMSLNYSFYSAFLMKTYEINDAYLIKKYLKPNFKPIIIGGGIGFIASLAQSIVKKKVPIFEIDSRIISILKKNLKVNNIKSVIYQSFFFLNKRPKINRVYLSRNFITTSIYSYPQKNNAKYRNVNLSNSVVSIKSLSKEHKCAYDTLIIDAEGYEYDVITDIKNSNIKHIFFELHKSIIGIKKNNQIFNSLKKNNFFLKEKFFNSYYYYKIN
jgi:FkbM family methyltransferase